MENFIYQNPTKIFFGKGTEKQTGKITKDHSDRIFLHYGGGSIKKYAIYASVTDSLKKEEVSFIELSGVRPNPVLEMMKKGIDICRKEKIGFILSVGGGSVIDSAKAIASTLSSSPVTAIIYLTFLVIPFIAMKQVFTNLFKKGQV